MGMLARSLPLALALLAYGCQVSEEVFAVVGKEEVRVAALQAYLTEVTSEEWQALEQRVASRLLDQFLDQEVVLAAARGRTDLPAPLTPERRSATVRLLLDEVCGPAPPVPAQLLEREIERRLQQNEPARAHVRQMLLGSRKEAEAARQRVLGGEDFVKVSKEVSLAANAEGGGELGPVVQGTLPEPMDEVIFALPVGSVSEPVAGPSGYHIFEVLEIHDAGPPNRQRTEQEVQQVLGQEHSRQFMRACIDRLASEVGVTVHASHLWFQYQGKYQEEERNE